MNNIFPNHIQGETLGILIAEHLRSPERVVMRTVSTGWKLLADRSSAICTEKAKELVDTFTPSLQKSLKVCFLQPVDPNMLHHNIEEWGLEIRERSIRIFKKFSQSELEEYTRDPTKAILMKGQAISENNVQKIAHLGAHILSDMIFLGEDIPSLPSKPTSIAESIAQQELTEYSKSLIAGTIKRMETASIFAPLPSYYEIISNLKRIEITNGLQSRLFTTFCHDLGSDYEKTFSNQELIKLYRLRSQHLYRTIHKEIKRPLQFKAIIWITSQSY